MSFMIDISEREKVLNKKRDEVRQYLNSHPEITNYHIAKDELENLLFSTNYVLGYNSSKWGEDYFSIPGYASMKEVKKMVDLDDLDSIKKHGILAKFPVWSGPFLRQIDLSEVDFSHVVWDEEVRFELDLFWAFDCSYIEYSNYRILIVDGIKNRVPYVNFSHTNVAPDFKNSFESFILNDKVPISNINLNGVDLSHSNTEKLTLASCCSFVGTNFKLNPNNFSANDSDFRGIDLSSYRSFFLQIAYLLLHVNYNIFRIILKWISITNTFLSIVMWKILD